MSYDKEQATEEFTRWSESYDKCILQTLLFGPSHRAIIRRLKTTYGDRPLKILDVGCGTGVFAARIREALPSAQVWGIDLVAGMLQQGKNRWKTHSAHVQPIQADSERLPFGAGTFDVVTCANSFHHYPHQDRAVAEMTRVLKPGGRVMLIDGFRDGLWGWFIYDLCVTYREGAVHHCSRARFRDLFTQSGLTSTTQAVHHGFAPFVLNEAIAPASSVPKPHFARERSRVLS